MRFAILFFLSIFTSCNGQTNLPKELPSNIEIIYTSDGGMLPSLFRVEINRQMMKITKNSPETNRKDVIREVKLKEGEVKDLYQAFIENNFDFIKPNEEIHVADGKYRSIELKFGDQKFYGINGDGIQPPKGHGERFKKIEDAIGKLISEHPENSSSKYLDKIAVLEFNPSYHSFMFGMEGNPTELSEKEIEETNEIVKRAFDDYNSKQNAKIKFDDYKFQFVPVLTAKNEKVIGVNVFCNANDNWTKTEWRKQLIRVKDGGNCFGHLTVNLTSKTSTKFQPNGEA